MKTVYHYTNESGFKALSSGATWYPSTGIPLSPERSLLEHMQLSLIRSQKLFFRKQYDTRDYVNTQSIHFPDVYYGPGWYVTETPPNATTHQLLTELWSGNQDSEDKTQYWLKLVTTEHRLKLPDPSRPSVAYLPIYQELGGDTNRPAGISTDPVLLVEAGYRKQRSGAQVDVEVVLSYDPAVGVVPAMITAIDGWSHLEVDEQCNILGFMGFDSGFPGVPFPTGVAGLSVDRKQLFAIAQIATRSLGAGLELLDVVEIGHTKSKEEFCFDLKANLTLQSGRLRTFVHCRHQKSPMRLEHIKSLIERAKNQQAKIIIAFVTSTFAENALTILSGKRIAPVLVTSAQRKDRRRSAMRMAIMDGEAIKYPAHDFWIPVKAREGTIFQEVRTQKQILELI